MTSKKAVLEHLRKVPLFAACSTKELETIARSSERISMPAGTLVLDQGQVGKEAFVILSGAVTVRRNGKKVATLGPGAVVGELSLFHDGPRAVTAICDTDCTLLLLSHRHLVGVLDDEPGISHKLLASLAGRVRQLDRQYYG